MSIQMIKIMWYVPLHAEDVDYVFIKNKPKLCLI